MNPENQIQLKLTPKQAGSETDIKQCLSLKLRIDVQRIHEIRIIKKSIDARSQHPVVLLTVQYFIDAPATAILYAKPHYQAVNHDAPHVIIVGAGPAGLFAALRLIEDGVKPIILERGKEVAERKLDIAKLNRNEPAHRNSNYCFGEGGAGTFSDGKIYTRSKKRGNIQRIFEIFHYHGAANNILYESHPHMGSDNLPKVIKNMRTTILECGGEIHFNTEVTEFIIENNAIKGCKTADNIVYNSNRLILAIGHSAHDTYELLHNNGVDLEAKGFAIGVRVEHPQQIIDTMQYHMPKRSEYLPAASYSWVEQVDGRGVYSFCMCPGGTIVPAGTGDSNLVVNGMSASRRNSPFANSGIVVEIRTEDIPSEFAQYGALAGLKYQQYVEQLCYQHRGEIGLIAPAQRLVDFVNNRTSPHLPKCSYLPGIVSSPLHEWLPKPIAKRLQEGFKQVGRKKRMYLTNNAVIIGVETRSSSPVRIPRNNETLEHVKIRGLYPVGEGSGYAGGITSSAMDGRNTAEKILEMQSNPN